jgi:hypothetical protein
MPRSQRAERPRKYEPLAEHLAALPRSRNEVTLSFADVERIIGDDLPPSAREYRQWWENQDRGSHAPLWLAAGFKVDSVDFSRERVRFTRLTPAPGEQPSAMTLQEVVTAVNEGVQGRPIGGLPDWRKTHKGKGQLPKTLFYSEARERDYVFHVGGLSELQFNVGFEPVNELRTFRHGIAFSLRPTREIPYSEVVGLLAPKIERFNEFLSIYPNAFAGFSMWHWSKDDDRSNNYPVAPIRDELVREGFFIFIGRLQPQDRIDVDLILDDFDRLLPVYEYVEGADAFPARVPEGERKGFVWSTGNKARVTYTAFERSAKTVEKSLRHNALQPVLFAYLEQIHGAENTKGELHTGNGTLIDVAVREGKGYVYYEIKTGLSAQACIREAIGQLMEYSYWPGAQEADRLVIVGEVRLDKDAKAYLARLRENFKLPVEYRQLDMKSCRLI